MIRRTWPLLVSLAISGGVAGTAIAGLPSSGPDAIVVIAPTQITSASAPTAVVASEAPVASPPAPTAPEPTLGRQDIRLAIANGDSTRTDLATLGAGRLAAAGYTQVGVDGSPQDAPVTTVYFRPGFDDEAWMVSGDLLMPSAPLVPMPADGVTGNDAAADIVIVLGADYVA